jgi:hypothetical protein
MERIVNTRPQPHTAEPKRRCVAGGKESKSAKEWAAKPSLWLAVAAKKAGGFAAKFLTQSSAKCTHQRVLPSAILVVEGVPLDFLKIIVSEGKLACFAVDSSLHSNHQLWISAVEFGGGVLLIQFCDFARLQDDRLH